MLTVTVTREVSAPVTLVWATFADLDRRSSWMSTVEDIEVLTSGEFSVGTRWRESRTVDGTPVTEELVVTELMPGRRCVIAFTGDGVAYRLTYRFEQIRVGRHQGGTTVTTTLQGTPHSRASRILAFLLGGLAARTVNGALRAELDDLAAYCTDQASDAA